MRRFWLLLLWWLSGSMAYGAAIDHTFVEQNTAQTHNTSTPTDITGAAITSGNFTAGKKYLIFNTYAPNEDASGLLTIRTEHGSTDFAESVQTFNIASTNAFRFPTGWFTVWTAVSSEGIKLQHSVSSGNVSTDQIAMLKINLSDDVTENTDWFFAERSTDDALSTTPSDGASITFSIAGTWLVCTYAQVDITDASTSVTSAIVRSGEAASSLPQGLLHEQSTSAVLPFVLCRVFTTTAASNTFKEQSVASGSFHTRLHSSIFALNLEKFAARTSAYTEADTNLSGSNYATAVQTASITPTVTGDVWILAAWGFDQNDTAREMEARLQVDNTDVPSDWTSDNYQFAVAGGASGTQEQPMVLSTMTSLDNAAHTIDLDGSADSTTGTPAAQQRTLMAVTMELAGAGGGTRRRVSPMVFQ